MRQKNGRTCHNYILKIRFCYSDNGLPEQWAGGDDRSTQFIIIAITLRKIVKDLYHKYSIISRWGLETQFLNVFYLKTVNPTKITV